MKILFIRHAVALDRALWSKEDYLRPLSKEGIDEAEKFFAKLPKLYKKIDLILTSKATRAKHTAKILNGYFKSEIKEVDELMVGHGLYEFLTLFSKIDKNLKYIAVVGHEPNLSSIISALVSDSSFNIKIKKASLIEIELFDKENLRGELKAYIPPKIGLRLS